jgi:transposase
MSRKDVEQIVALRVSGMSIGAIAKMLGWNKHSIEYRLNANADDEESGLSRRHYRREE